MRLNGERLRNVQPGDLVERVLFGRSPERLRVSQVTEDSIVCEARAFDRATGLQLAGGRLDLESYIRPTSQLAG